MHGPDRRLSFRRPAGGAAAGAGAGQPPQPAGSQDRQDGKLILPRRSASAWRRVAPVTVTRLTEAVAPVTVPRYCSCMPTVTFKRRVGREAVLCRGSTRERERERERELY